MLLHASLKASYFTSTVPVSRFLLLVKRPAKHPARSAGRLSLFALDSSPFLPRSLTFSRLHFYQRTRFYRGSFLFSPSSSSLSFSFFFFLFLPRPKFLETSITGQSVSRRNWNEDFQRWNWSSVREASGFSFFSFFKLPLFTIFELRIYIIKNNRILIGPTVELRFNILNIGSIKIYRSKLFPIRCNEISLEILWDNNIFNEYFSLFNT